MYNLLRPSLEPWFREAIARAPKKQPAQSPTKPVASAPRGRDENGTWVRVKAYDISESNGGRHSKQWPDHMYVEYDDGRDQIIARGGPSAQGTQFFKDGLAGRLRVAAEVTPASQSQDYGRGGRILYETFLPYKTADEAAAPAREEMARANRGENLYGKWVNSNSFVGNVTERQFGRRIGDDQTWGYKTRLGDGSAKR